MAPIAYVRGYLNEALSVPVWAGRPDTWAAPFVAIRPAGGEGRINPALEGRRFVIEAWGRTVEEAEDLADDTRRLLAAAQKWGGVPFYRCREEGAPAPMIPADDAQLYEDRNVITFTFSMRFRMAA